ncbi:MAG: hypothetical protein JWM12_760 [Ilumatobacteraceae bacterium]|nr:hypothetical protein [Ilumatobacteraceae bacterium]
MGSDQSLHHVLIVAGTPSEWAATPDEQWAHRLADLGKVADHVGASWLTIRPSGPDAAGTGSDGGSDGDTEDPPRPPASRTDVVGGCTVEAVAAVDGRQRLVAAIEALRLAGTEITETSITVELNAPARADPDLVVVLGPDHRLPASLVWELAYSELVFVDAGWADLQPAHVERAIDEFTHRHRRFGGLD